MGKELEVGDTISYLPKGSNFTYCVVKVANQYHIAHLNHLLASSATWQYGIHESLLPTGWQLVPIIPTYDMLTKGKFYGGDSLAGNWKEMLAVAPKYENTTHEN